MEIFFLICFIFLGVGCPIMGFIGHEPVMVVLPLIFDLSFILSIIIAKIDGFESPDSLPHW